MSVTSKATAAHIINRVASEVGLATTSDPYASTEDHFVQMTYLLQTCGEELCLAYPWEFLTESHQITTVAATDTGDYALPADFQYMIAQTGWEHANNVPLGGPLTPQDWTYLVGRDLSSSTIYASFRLREGQFSVFPQPPPDGLDINFEYQRRTWVSSVSSGLDVADIVVSTDVPYFDRTLISRMLKVKFLESKGFDTTKAQDDFNQIYGFITGKDKSAEIVNAGGRGGSVPYLNSYRNVGDTGFGS
tara:strand:- start:2428 stop:3168 length:741 start_codon:yes stop_codon:yes gene_type:complete